MAGQLHVAALVIPFNGPIADLMGFVFAIHHNRHNAFVTHPPRPPSALSHQALSADVCSTRNYLACVFVDYFAVAQQNK